MIRSLVVSTLIAALGAPAFSGSENLFYPLRTDWQSSDKKVNISAYLFNDLNENGSYDIGDRAIANIAVGLSRNGTPIAASRTNLNGFANFRASTTQEDSPLSTAGNYEFGALIPRGWRVTTANQTQTRELIAIAGSPAGLGLTEMLTPIGISRNKFIRGTYLGEQDGHIELHQNGKAVAMADVTENDQFIWSVKRGEYTLMTNGVPRPVIVGDYPVDIGLAAVPVANDIAGRTIDFETGATTGLNKAQNGYAGLNWFNLNIMRSDHTPGSIGYSNGTTSGNHILYTSSGHPGRIYADTPFSLLSVNLSAAWPDSEGEEAVFSYYRDDVLVLTDTIGLSAYSPISYQPMIEGITRVEISTKHYWQLVIDDLVVLTAP